MPAEATPALEDAEFADRAAVHRWGRAELRRSRAALRRYRRMARRSRKAVLKARVPQQRERVRQRLTAMPVEQLAKGRGIDTKALRRGGVATAADVEEHSAERLDAIRGVGLTTAQTIKALASDLARTRPEDLRPPGNPDTWKPADYALARTLRPAIRFQSRAIRPARPPQHPGRGSIETTRQHG